MNRTFIFGRAYDVHNLALTVYYWSFYPYFVNSILICLIVSLKNDVYSTIIYFVENTLLILCMPYCLFTIFHLWIAIYLWKKPPLPPKKVK